MKCAIKIGLVAVMMSVGVGCAGSTSTGALAESPDEALSPELQAQVEMLRSDMLPGSCGVSWTSAGHSEVASTEGQTRPTSLRRNETTSANQLKGRLQPPRR